MRARPAGRWQVGGGGTPRFQRRQREVQRARLVAWRRTWPSGCGHAHARWGPGDEHGHATGYIRMGMTGGESGASPTKESCGELRKPPTSEALA